MGKFGKYRREIGQILKNNINKNQKNIGIHQNKASEKYRKNVGEKNHKNKRI